MKVLVAYLSKTGNTKKVAEAIYGEITDEKEIKPIADVESLDGYDAAFLGFPIQQMGPDNKSAELLARRCTGGRKVVLFITHASPEDNPELQPMLDKFRDAARGANVIDMFDCQGELGGCVKFFMRVMPDPKLRMWAKMDNSKGQPDAARLQRARVFARDVMRRLHNAPGAAAEPFPLYAVAGK